MSIRTILAIAIGCLIGAGCARSERTQEGSPAPVSYGYRVDPSWPAKPPGIQWGQMPGVAVDGDLVWIFTRNMPVVQAYHRSTGKLVKKWDHIEYGKAHHIKIGPEGNVWLADVELHTVRKHARDGKLLLTLGTPGAAGEDESHLNKPTDMVVTPAGDIFVSDGYGNNRIVHFAKDGKFVKAWGRKGTAPGEFNLPHGIDVDSKGRLYVADRSNARIQVFEQSGKFLASWETFLVPWSIWITEKDEIWTCGSTPTLLANAMGQTGIPPHDQVMMKLDTTGRVLRLWSPELGQGKDSKPGETAWIHIVASDKDGNLYAGDIMGERVQKYVPRK